MRDVLEELIEEVKEEVGTFFYYEVIKGLKSSDIENLVEFFDKEIYKSSKYAKAEEKVVNAFNFWGNMQEQERQIKDSAAAFVEFVIEEYKESLRGCGCGSGCFNCLDVSWSDFV